MVRCNDQATVYIDGKLMGTTIEKTEIWTGDVPNNASTVAIKCENTADYGGLIASFSNGLITDGDWKCAKDVTGMSWIEISYDDSHWPGAEVLHSVYRQDLYTGFTPNFPDYIPWIWMDDFSPAKTGAIFCRRQLGRLLYLTTVQLSVIFLHFLVPGDKAQSLTNLDLTRAS